MSVYKVIPIPNDHSTGQFDQITNFHGPFDLRGSKSYRRIPLKGTINFDIQFPIFKMLDKGILTDNLHCVPMRSIPLVSSTALEVFQKTKSDDFQHFGVKVFHKDKLYDYHAIHFSNQRQNEVINWDTSTFNIFNTKSYNFKTGMPTETKEIVFNDYNQYISKLRSLKGSHYSIRMKNIKLTDKIPCSFFKMGSPFSGHYCTNALKTEIEKSDLSGFGFIPIEN